MPLTPEQIETLRRPDLHLTPEPNGIRGGRDLTSEPQRHNPPILRCGADNPGSSQDDFKEEPCP